MDIIEALRPHVDRIFQAGVERGRSLAGTPADDSPFVTKADLDAGEGGHAESHLHAIRDAMLHHACHAAENGYEMLPGIDALVSLLDNPHHVDRVLKGGCRPRFTKSYEGAHSKADAGRAVGVPYESTNHPGLWFVKRQEGGGRTRTVRTRNPSRVADEARRAYASARVREINTRFAHYGTTPHDLRELAEHLPHLTPRELARARELMSVRHGGATAKNVYGGATGHKERVRLLAEYARAAAQDVEGHGADSPAMAGEVSQGEAGGWMPGAATHREPQAEPAPAPPQEESPAVAAARANVERLWNRFAETDVGSREAAAAKANLARAKQRLSDLLAEQAAGPQPEAAPHAELHIPDQVPEDVAAQSRGNLFDAGDTHTPGKAAQLLDKVFDRAANLPGIGHVDHPGARAGVPERLRALSAVDAHARKLLGEDAPPAYRRGMHGVFSELEEAHSEAHAELADADAKELHGSERERNKVREAAETGIENALHYAEEMGDALDRAGHPDLANFYRRDAHAAAQAAADDVSEATEAKAATHVPKQPHEMSHDEYREETPWSRHADAAGRREFTEAEARKHAAELQAGGHDARPYYLRTQGNRRLHAVDTRPSHATAIRQALAEGKPVPDEVMEDYPDLAPQHAPPPKGDEWEPIPKTGTGYEGGSETFRVGADKVGKVHPSPESAAMEEVASRAAEAMGLPGARYSATTTPDGRPAVVSDRLDAEPALDHPRGSDALAGLSPEDVARHTLHAYLTADNDRHSGKNFMVDKGGNLVPIDYGAAFDPDDGTPGHDTGATAAKYNLVFQSQHDGARRPVPPGELDRAVAAGERMVRDMGSRGLPPDQIAGAKERVGRLRALAAMPAATYGDLLSPAAPEAAPEAATEMAPTAPATKRSAKQPAPARDHAAEADALPLAPPHKAVINAQLNAAETPAEKEAVLANARKVAGLPPKGLDNVGQNASMSGGGPTPEAHDVLAGEGEGAGGLPAGERLGGGVPRGARAGSPGAGQGTGQGTGGVRPGADGGRAGAVRADDGAGDAAGRGEGTGDARPARKRRVRSAPNAPRTGPDSARDEATGRLLGGGLDGSAPAIPDPTPAEQVVSEPPAPENPTDLAAGNWRYHDREFYKGGLKAKFNANLAAVRTLRAIQAEGRTHATPEEQAILSKFTGWGQFPAVFNDFYDRDEHGSAFREKLEASGTDYAEWTRRQQEWRQERQTLRSMMSDDEWESAKASTLNAHYTHPDVVDAHWKLAERLGFKGGRYLETSAGVGYYLGLMPGHLASQTRASAVEKDPTTGAMLKLLYPNANVNVQGFEEHLAPDHYYDLVASNVPFGGYKVHDPRYNKHRANIHDYFFLKSLDKVKPGGLVMHITSAGTLDKMDPKVRAELARQGDLVGAIRFPGAAHKENAGTDVVTDMIVLRKRLPGEEPGDASWTETTTVPDPAGGEPIPVNKYFAANPHMVLGTIDRTGSMYKGDSANVSRTDDYEQRLARAIRSMPKNVMATNRAPAKRFEPEVLPAPGEVKNHGFHMADGKVYVRKDGGLVQQDLPPAAVKKVGDHLAVRDALRAVVNAETAGRDSATERAALNRVYDAFVKKHGLLSASGNRRLFATDPDSPNLLALENYDPKTKKATKADIFTRPTVSAYASPTSAGSVSEGLGISLHEFGKLDVSHIAKLTGHHPREVERQLGEQGLAYEDPSEGWKPAEHYLSGNVRRKLALARAAAAGDPKFEANVKALERVQPDDIHHDDISVKLGAPWVPPSDFANFAAHLLQTTPDSFHVQRNPATGEWHADYTRRGGYAKTSAAARSVWGDRGWNALEIVTSLMNGKPIKVMRPTADGKSSELDPEATEAVNAKARDIKEEFKNWVWTDDERRGRLHRYYNDNFNNIRNIAYDGAHQKLPGLDPAIKLRDHQKNFVWQTVTTGKGLAGHEVGTGKTLSLVAAAMELRRLGLAKKPAIACLKANVEAVTRDAQRAYPGAKIISTVDMFDAKKRKDTIARIATGDYDMVILTHDHLNMLAMRPETQQKYMQEELADLEATYEDAFESSGKDKNNRVVKQLAKAKESLKEKLQKAIGAEKKDNAVHFEDLGIDHLFVDEAHEYKSLPVYTRQQGLKGIPGGRSQRATNMLMRTRWLTERNGGRGVTFLTGTPVSNTMAELYNMQRYIQPEELKQRGIHTFDDWANQFGEVETKMEKTATGVYKNVSRFSKFVNLPELMHMSRQMLDVQRATDMKNPDGTPVIKRPDRKDAVHRAPRSDQVNRMMNELVARAEKLKGKGRAEKGGDNMLSICTDGRKGSIDMRMLYADAPDDPGSKTNRLVDNVLSIHKANPGKTQMVFSDIGVNAIKNKGGAPEGDDAAAEGEESDIDGIDPDADLESRTGFHLYGDVIDKLVRGGIPREKIADFSQLEGAKKEEAMDGLRKGEILVALGSTKKLGTGVNAQHKVVAMHHLDCPWRPADLEQRDGRGWRQGNENKEVQVHKYVTEGSLDELLWQGIARKAAFIRQAMKPTSKLDREIKEEDTDELSPEAIMAAASGDPRILERVQLDDDVKQLTNARTRHDREQAAFRDALARGEQRAKNHRDRINDFHATAEHLDANPDFAFHTRHGEEHTERKDAERALEQASVSAPTTYASHIGTYRGLPIYKDQGRVYLQTKNGERLSTEGTLASVEAVARQMRSRKATAEGDLAQHEKDREQIRAKVGKPFPRAVELAAKAERLKALEAELSAKKEEAPPEGAASNSPTNVATGVDKPTSVGNNPPVEPPKPGGGNAGGGKMAQVKRVAPNGKVFEGAVRSSKSGEFKGVPVTLEHIEVPEFAPTEMFPSPPMKHVAVVSKGGKVHSVFEMKSEQEAADWFKKNAATLPGGN